MSFLVTLVVLALVVVVVLALLASIKSIGPTEVGLVTKRVGFGKLAADNPIAFHGEAGYQARLLMPGLRFKLWPVYGVKKFPWVQVPAGEIGVVIAQVGTQLPVGAKSAVFRPEFGNFANLASFVDNGGQKGVQRPVLPPGTLLPMHPVGFMVLTARKVYGLPVSPDIVARVRGAGGVLRPETFGLTPEQLQVVVIAPNGPQDVVGIVTAPRNRSIPRSSRCCWAARTRCTTTIRTTRRSWTRAARSGCSTTRCCTARTC
jgi:hypothetical protein